MIIGLMSGTSMDGLDIVATEFENRDNNFSYEIIASKTYEYDDKLRNRLSQSSELSALQMRQFDLEFGTIMANYVNEFCIEFKINKNEIEFISSHGHTVFHQPEKGITFQIGSGHTLAYQTKLKVINDFRTKDVIAGGQGAPLVPIGDKLLFVNEAEAFINLGGFANISFTHNKEVNAFDICPLNLPLNKLVQLNNLANGLSGVEYDKNGSLAEKGTLNFFLFDLLNNLPYYKIDKHKSLGIEWLDEHFYPLIKTKKDIESNLRSIVEHIAFQIAETLQKHDLKSVLFSGGGVYNKFLMSRIKHYFKGEIKIPTKEIIEFKEALIFAFLGYLYSKNEVNSLKSVTGAKSDLVNGVIYLP